MNWKKLQRIRLHIFIDVILIAAFLLVTFLSIAAGESRGPNWTYFDYINASLGSLFLVHQLISLLTCIYLFFIQKWRKGIALLVLSLFSFFLGYLLLFLYLMMRNPVT